MRRILLTTLAVMTVAVVLGSITWKANRKVPPLQAAATSSLQESIHVFPNVRISAKFDRYNFDFCDVASDHHDAARIFAAVCRWRRNDLDIVGFYSQDGGATWATGCERHAEKGERLSDMSVAFGTDGTLFLVHMRSDPKVVKPLGTPDGTTVEFAVSHDGGASWAEASRLTTNLDRPWITVDTTNGDYRGRLYCVANVDEPVVYASDNLATTLMEPTFPRGGRRFANCRHAEPVVGADGSVVVVVQGRGRRTERVPRMYCYRSTDGGRTFEERSPVSTEWSHERLKSSQGVMTMWPRLAADTTNTQFKGRVYCVWGDGADDSGNGERIMFSSTSDYGNTWSAPVVISEQPMDAESASPEYMSFKPSVAVNNTGIVAVSWYDRRGMPGPVRLPTGTKDVYYVKAEGWNVRLRLSLDGGATWPPSMQINAEPGTGTIRVGHAAGMTAASDGSFHPVWIDNRTGNGQLWTSRVEWDHHK